MISDSVLLNNKAIFFKLSTSGHESPLSHLETALSVNDIGEKDIDQIILSYIDSLEDDEIDFDTVKEYYTLTLPYYIALKFINEEKEPLGSFLI